MSEALDAEQSLGWCGDWAVYGGVEGAALSGKSVAETIARFARGEPAGPDALPDDDRAWEEIGCRTPPECVRLGHGCFHLKHARLRSIEPPAATMSASDAEAFWSKLKQWGYGTEKRVGDAPSSLKRKARAPREKNRDRKAVV